MQVDITGKRYGRLVAVKSDCAGKWKFICDCGKSIVATKGNVTSGKTNSCGCLRNERVREANSVHGLAGSRLYKIWGNMIHRCHNQTDVRYADYGGRGIFVCDEWRGDPVSFVLWANSNGYSEDLTLDRQNNDKGYSPENCRWATRDQQVGNKRTNHVIDTPAGRMTISEAAKTLGVKDSTLRNRIWNHRPYNDLFTRMEVTL